MKIQIICPIPPEYKACCNVLSLKPENEKNRKIMYNRINKNDGFIEEVKKINNVFQEMIQNRYWKK